MIEPPPRQKLVQFGNLLYFFLRPIYSFVFVVIAIFAMLSGLIIITASVDYVLNERFLYLSVIISSFIGFSTGRVLDRFEELSNKKVDETLKVEKGVIR